jgi:hypothetical protein
MLVYTPIPYSHFPTPISQIPNSPIQQFPNSPIPQFNKSTNQQINNSTTQQIYLFINRIFLKLQDYK